VCVWGGGGEVKGFNSVLPHDSNDNDKPNNNDDDIKQTFRCEAKSLSPTRTSRSPTLTPCSAAVPLADVTCTAPFNCFCCGLLFVG
jgi:hypothetical protein